MRHLNFNNFEWIHDKDNQRIFNTLETDGGEGRFVGGAVRNSLLNEKINEIDVATTCTPKDVMQLFENKGFKVFPIGLDHGTITVVKEGFIYEITTLRKDEKTYGRNADVKFITDWEKDALRRDFTINAIYVNKNGALFDFYNGIDDLRNGKIRFIGYAEDRVKEDYLRILRFFRFFTFYGLGSMEEHTVETCQRNIEGLKIVSSERISTEILKILSADDPICVINCMNEINLFDLLGITCHIDMFAALLDFEHFIGKFSSITMRLSALLGHNNFKYFCLSKKHKARIKNIERFYQSKEKIDHVTILKLLHTYDIETVRDILFLSFYRTDIDAEAFNSLLKFIQSYVVRDFPLSGKIMISQGANEGPMLGKTLLKVKTYWLINLCRPSLEDCMDKFWELYKCNGNTQ